MTWFKNPSAAQEKDDSSFRSSPLSLLTGTSNNSKSKKTSKRRSTRARLSTGAVVVPNLLLLLLLAFCCCCSCSYIVEAQIVINPIASITDRCSTGTVQTQTEIVGCNSVNVDLYDFQVKYPDVVAGASNSRNPYWDGTMECGMPLTLEQSAKEPTLSRRTSTSEVDDEEYYTVLLVDTTAADSSSHPILHYGASNVQFDRTNDLVLSDLSPFSEYQGPSSPDGGVQQRSEIFATYEWIVAKQAAGKIVEQELQLALLNSGRQGTEEFEFDYDRYLSGERGGVNATMVFSTYFQSGSCVDPTPVGTIIQEFLDNMEIALSSGYPSLVSSSLSKVMALVTSALFVFLL